MNTPASLAGASRLPTILWAAFTLFVVYGGTIPFDFTLDRAIVSEKLARISLNPLISPDTQRRVSISDVVQNAVLFVPFGALGVVALRRRRSTSSAVVRVVLLAATVSATVETLQLLEPDRTASMADVCWNVVGAAIGACAMLALVSVGRASFVRLEDRGLVAAPAFYPLLVAAVVLVLAAWEPFDFTLDVGTLVGKLRALRADVWQLGTFRDEGIELVRYTMFGLALSMWLRQVGARSATWLGAGIAAGCACALEASQWIVASRMPGLEDALVHAGGGVAGAALANGWPHGRSLRFWWAVVWAATGAGAVLQLLAPFAWTTAYHPMQWLLFANYYERTTVATLSHAFELALMYAPLGFAGAYAFRGRLAFGAAVVATVAIAFPIEYLQGWVVGRYADITDVLVSAAGAMAGASAGRLKFTAR